MSRTHPRLRHKCASAHPLHHLALAVVDAVLDKVQPQPLVLLAHPDRVVERAVVHQRQCDQATPATALLVSTLPAVCPVTSGPQLTERAVLTEQERCWTNNTGEQRRDRSSGSEH
eukprot:2997379-Rhodomonas_salina.1